MATTRRETRALCHACICIRALEHLGKACESSSSLLACLQRVRLAFAQEAPLVRTLQEAAQASIAKLDASTMAAEVEKATSIVDGKLATQRDSYVLALHLTQASRVKKVCLPCCTLPACWPLSCHAADGVRRVRACHQGLRITCCQRDNSSPGIRCHQSARFCTLAATPKHAGIMPLACFAHDLAYIIASSCSVQRLRCVADRARCFTRSCSAAEECARVYQSVPQEDGGGHPTGGVLHRPIRRGSQQ